ncbi:hypothetical protein NL676_020214 [Syzygium grande]|nr:hypothetical protein NL676_020214 [Syzygium grande]
MPSSRVPWIGPSLNPPFSAFSDLNRTPSDPPLVVNSGRGAPPPSTHVPSLAHDLSSLAQISPIGSISGLANAQGCSRGPKAGLVPPRPHDRPSFAQTCPQSSLPPSPNPSKDVLRISPVQQLQLNPKAALASFVDPNPSGHNGQQPEDFTNNSSSSSGVSAVSHNGEEISDSEGQMEEDSAGFSPPTTRSRKLASYYVGDPSKASLGPIPIPSHPGIPPSSPSSKKKGKKKKPKKSRT